LTDRQKDRINIASTRIALRAVIGKNKIYCLFDVQKLKTCQNNTAPDIAH